MSSLSWFMLRSWQFFPPLILYLDCNCQHSEESKHHSIIRKSCFDLAGSPRPRVHGLYFENHCSKFSENTQKSLLVFMNLPTFSFSTSAILGKWKSFIIQVYHFCFTSVAHRISLQLCRAFSYMVIWKVWIIDITSFKHLA